MTYENVAELLERLADVMGSDVLLQISDKQSPRGLGMELVELSVVRPRLVILHVISKHNKHNNYYKHAL